MELNTVVAAVRAGWTRLFIMCLCELCLLSAGSVFLQAVRGWEEGAWPRFWSDDSRSTCPTECVSVQPVLNRSLRWRGGHMTHSWICSVPTRRRLGGLVIVTCELCCVDACQSILTERVLLLFYGKSGITCFFHWSQDRSVVHWTGLKAMVTFQMCGTYYIVVFFLPFTETQKSLGALVRMPKSLLCISEDFKKTQRGRDKTLLCDELDVWALWQWQSEESGHL